MNIFLKFIFISLYNISNPGSNLSYQRHGLLLEWQWNHEATYLHSKCSDRCTAFKHFCEESINWRPEDALQSPQLTRGFAIVSLQGRDKDSES